MHGELDVAIVGGGLVGLALAAALRGSGLRLALIEPQPPRPVSSTETWDSRVYAISPGSAAFLDALGVWKGLPRGRVTRVEAMEIYGDDRASRLDFSAYDAGLRELAFIVENRALQQELWRAVDKAEVKILSPANCLALAFDQENVTLTLDDGTQLRARLVVGADGAGSRVREQAGITMTPTDYGQLGVVANFSCERPHRGVAFQWFRRDGVLALLPLAGDRISMVWSIAREQGEQLQALAADALAAEVHTASNDAVGALELITPPAAFPLRLQRVAQFVRPRAALIGDAAHNVHPLAGQGVNLGFRDARTLATALAAREARYDCGDYALLRRYERARREDVAVMQFTTDALKKLFAAERVSVARVRNAGLRMVNRQPQLKAFLVRQAVA